MPTTTNMGIVLMDAGQSQKEVTINNALNAIDAQVLLKAGGTMTGGLKIQRAAVASGTPDPSLWVVTPADTGLAAGVESNSIKFDFTATRQFAAGAIANQRAMLIIGPTYSATGATTITSAATVHIFGTPTAGSNVTINNAAALWVQGAVNFGSLIQGTSKAGQSYAQARNAVQPNGFYTAPINSGTLAASTESYLTYWDPNGTITYATGALTNQRENLFRAPTYAFVGASTVTNVATVAIEGAPVLGANASFTNNYALWIQDGGLRVQGHLFFGGGTTPTAAAGANAGTSPPAPVVTAGDTDSRGNITFGTGTGPAAGEQVVTTFNTAYGTAPFVWITERNTATQALGLYVSSTNTTQFKVSCTNAPTASQGNTTYSFDYFTVQ